MFASNEYARELALPLATRSSQLMLPLSVPSNLSIGLSSLADSASFLRLSELQYASIPLSELMLTCLESQFVDVYGCGMLLKH